MKQVDWTKNLVAGDRPFCGFKSGLCQRKSEAEVQKLAGLLTADLGGFSQWPWVY
jgi:hypothetical protein